MRAGQNNVKRERRKSERVYLTSGGEGVTTFLHDNYEENSSVARTERDDLTVLLNPDFFKGQSDSF